MAKRSRSVAYIPRDEQLSEMDELSAKEMAFLDRLGDVLMNVPARFELIANGGQELVIIDRAYLPEGIEPSAQNATDASCVLAVVSSNVSIHAFVE